MLELKYGTKYTFKTNAPFILGNKYENMLYVGTVAYNIANRLGTNCQLIHRQIYHLLPKSTPDNATLYKYHLFLNEDKVLKILGDPWIDDSSVDDGKKSNYTIVIKNILNDDAELISSVIKDCGYSEFKTRKTKSTNGITNSMFEIISGNVPVGGGLDDGEHGTEIIDDGSVAIGKPIIKSELSGEFNPYVSFIFSDFIDALTTQITHYSTDIEVSINNTFNELVWEASEDIVNLTRLKHIPNLVNESTYYIRVRYTSNVGSKSKWSEPYRFVFKEYYTAPSGRKFKRHDSNKASIMLWVDKSGIERSTLILDAKYRKKLRMIKPNVDITMVNDLKYDKAEFNLSIKDEELFLREDYFEDSKTSKDLTDIYCSLDAGTQSACGWVITNTVLHDGVLYPCSIPNIQTAIRIMADAVVIDKLDPTSTDTEFNLVVDSPYIWSSSKYETEVQEYNNGIKSYSNKFWTVNNFASLSYTDSSALVNIVPVVEL